MSAAEGASPDYFELFSLPASYRIDLGELERRYKALMGEVHPDRFARDSERTRRLAVQYAALANEAYATLSDPLRRGSYIVGRHGFDPFDELNTDMPGDFLMRQLELREEIEDAAGDPAALARARADVDDEIARHQDQLAELLDVGRAWERGAQKLREMSYFVKLRGEIERGLAQTPLADG